MGGRSTRMDGKGFSTHGTERRITLRVAYPKNASKAFDLGESFSNLFCPGP